MVTTRKGLMAIRKRYGLILLAGALGALVLTASVSAMRERSAVTVPSRISISYDAANGVFRGRVTSRNRRCVASRRVELREVLPGRDRVMGRTRADRRGNWRVVRRVGNRSFLQTPRTRQFEAFAPSSTPPGGPTGLFTIHCGLARSRTVTIPVAEDFGGQALAERHPQLADHHIIRVGLFNRTVDRVEITTSAPFQRVDQQALVFAPNVGFRFVPAIRDSDHEISIALGPALQTTEFVQVAAQGLPSGTRVEIEPFQAGTRGKAMVVTAQ